MAAPSTGGPAERRERLRPISPIAPIAAARTTLGSGRASTTNPASATSASTGRHRRGTPTTTQRPRTSPVTTATLLPLTAVRWVMPVARIAAVRSSGVRLVSPMTRPGSSPRASGGAWSSEERSPARRRSAADATAPGDSSTWGAPLTDRVATRSSAGSVGPSRPRTRTVDRQPGSAIAGSPVSSTGALVSRLSPRASSTRIVASRSTTGRSPRPASTIGSPVTTATAVTAARSAASCSTPPRARRMPCPAAATWSTATRTTASSSGPTTPERRSTRRAGRTAANAGQEQEGSDNHHEMARGREAQGGRGHGPREHGRAEQPQVGGRSPPRGADLPTRPASGVAWWQRERGGPRRPYGERTCASRRQHRPAIIAGGVRGGGGLVTTSPVA